MPVCKKSWWSGNYVGDDDDDDGKKDMRLIVMGDEGKGFYYSSVGRGDDCTLWEYDAPNIGGTGGVVWSHG